MSQGVYVLGGKCPGGKCPGGICPGGICPWGTCPGGTCPGGTCPGGLCPRTWKSSNARDFLAFPYNYGSILFICPGTQLIKREGDKTQTCYT